MIIEQTRRFCWAKLGVCRTYNYMNKNDSSLKQPEKLNFNAHQRKRTTPPSKNFSSAQVSLNFF
jgi:hypothetical protein